MTHTIHSTATRFMKGMALFAGITAMSEAVAATGAPGEITIRSQAPCTISLDPSPDVYRASVEFNTKNRVIPVGKRKSISIKFALNRGIFGSAEAGAQARCSAGGEADGNFWIGFFSGGATARFSTQAQCNAAFSGFVEGERGIFPGASLMITNAPTQDKEDRNLQISVAATSDSGAVITANIRDPQICGIDQGFYVASPRANAKTLLGQIVITTDGIVGGHFENHDIVIENMDNNAAFITPILLDEINIAQDAVHRQRVRLESISDLKITSSLRGKRTYKGIAHFVKRDPIVSDSEAGSIPFSVSSFAKLSQLQTCLGEHRSDDKTRLLIWPTNETPDDRKCFQ